MKRASQPVQPRVLEFDKVFAFGEKGPMGLVECWYIPFTTEKFGEE